MHKTYRDPHQLLTLLIAFLLVSWMLLPGMTVPIASAASSLAWIDSKGPGYSTAWALAYDSDNDILYRGTDNRGVWKYQDGKWSAMGGAVDGFPIRKLIFNPSTGVLYVGTYSHGVWSCKGSDWDDMGGALSSENISSMAFDPDSGMLYAANEGSNVWRWDGSSWEDIAVGAGLNSLRSLEYDPVNEYLYAGTYGRLMRWNGAAWEDTEFPSTSTNFFVLAYNAKDGLLYTATYENTGVYVYNGSEWNSTGGPISSDRVLSLSIRDGELYAGTNRHGVWRLDGSGWHDVSGSLSGFTIYSLLCVPGEKQIFAGTHGSGIWYGDGSGWAYTGIDFGESNIRALTYDPGHDRLYAGLGGGTVWEWDGSGWSFTGGPGGSDVFSLAYDPVHDLLYAGTWYSGVWRWNGSDWSNTNIPTGNDEIYSLAYDPEHDLVYAGTQNNGVLCLSGTAWTDIDGGTDTYYVRGLAYDQEHDFLYAGSTSGTRRWNGTSWTDIAGPGSQQALAYDADNEMLYAGTYNGGVWRWNGTAWADTGGGMGAYSVQSLCYDSEAGHDVLYAGTYNFGVWRYDGTAWTQAWPSGHDNRALAYDPSRNRIYAGTRSYGVWYALASYDVISSVPGGHGAVDPAFKGVEPGGSASLDIQPDPGYRIASVTDNGMPQTVADPYVISGINTDHSVAVSFEADPAAGSTFYFAEGYTGAGFQEYLCLGNPGASEAKASITYLYKDGSTRPGEVTIPANSRATVNVNAEAGAGMEVSLVVTSQQKIVAERPMYFNYNGKWTGGHDVVGATTPSYISYFAEGYTGSGFEEWICVLNPGDAPADLTFYFQTQEEGLKTVSGLSVPAHSRGSFKANDLLGGKSYQTSLTLASNQPIVAERPVYFDYTGTGGWHWEGGHCVMGATTLWSQYYFAEGTTRAGFEEWLTIQNPGLLPIEIDAVYQLGPGQGDPVNKTYSVPPSSRVTIYVPKEVGSGKDVSIYLSSASSFLAERPTYFNYSYRDLSAQGGHCVIGAAAPASEWFLAEGYTGGGFNQWLCLQNPGDTDASVEVTYYTQEQGALPPRQVSVPAHTRNTLMVNEHAGLGYQLSTRVKVLSGPSVVVERPMYFIYNGWDGGHDVVGYVP